MIFSTNKFDSNDSSQIKSLPLQEQETSLHLLMKLLQEKEKQIRDLKIGYEKFFFVLLQKVGGYQKLSNEEEDKYGSQIKSPLQQKHKIQQNTKRQDISQLLRLLVEKEKQIHDLKTGIDKFLLASTQKNNVYQTSQQIKTLNVSNQIVNHQYQYQIDEKQLVKIQQNVVYIEQMMFLVTKGKNVLEGLRNIQQSVKYRISKTDKIVKTKLHNILISLQSTFVQFINKIIEYKEQNLRQNTFQLLQLSKSTTNSTINSNKLQLEILRLQKEIDNLTKQNERLSKDSNQPIIGMQQLKNENISLKTKVYKNENEIVQHTTSLLSSKNVFQNQEEEINTKQKIIHRHKQNIEKCQENHLLQWKLKQLQKQLLNKTKDRQDILSQLQQVQIKYNQIEAKYNQIQEKYNLVKTEYQQSEQKLRQLQFNFQSLSSQNNTLKHQKQQNQQQIARFKTLQQSEIEHQNYYRQMIKSLQFKCSELQHCLQKKQQQQKKMVMSQIKKKQKLDYRKNYIIGMKLITSMMLHGLDRERHEIITKIQEFTKKRIRKTSFLMRYPLTKSMINYVKQDWPFLLMYRTKKNIVLGSYSDGMRKPTFLFTFRIRKEEEIEQQIRRQHQQQKKQQQLWCQQRQKQLQQTFQDQKYYQIINDNNSKDDLIRFYMPENNSRQTKVASIQLYQVKYLQYGNGELRINCIDMSYISANSDAIGEKYYNLDWRGVLQQNNQSHVGLVEVELHRVEFIQK